MQHLQHLRTRPGPESHQETEPPRFRIKWSQPGWRSPGVRWVPFNSGKLLLLAHVLCSRIIQHIWTQRDGSSPGPAAFSPFPCRFGFWKAAGLRLWSNCQMKIGAGRQNDRVCPKTETDFNLRTVRTRRIRVRGSGQ